MAKIFLELNENFTLSSSNCTVYGAAGSEKMTIGDGISGLTVDQNIERVIFASGIDNYKFKQAGNTLRVYDSTGTTLLAAIPVQGDSDGTAVEMGGATYDAKLTKGIMMLGASVVSSTSMTSLSGDGSVKVSITSSGTYADQGAAVKTAYTLPSAANLTYGISGFSSGDTISFPTETTPTVFNDSYTDGSASLLYAYNGSVATITLKGLTSAVDASLSTLASFDAAFGTGTIIYAANVSIASAGSNADSSSVKTKYTVATPSASTTYVYTISGFGMGDKIEFPNTNTPTVINTNLGDGNIILQYADGKTGTTLQIVLSGIGAINDAAIGGISDMNKVFGDGTVIYATYVPITSAGSNVDSSSLKTTYIVATPSAYTGGYTYTISGFGAGDRIDFPDTATTPSVQNSSFSDGSVILSSSFQSLGATVSIKLTGLTNAVDASLNSAADFNTVFGSGTIF